MTRFDRAERERICRAVERSLGKPIDARRAARLGVTQQQLRLWRRQFLEGGSRHLNEVLAGAARIAPAEDRQFELVRRALELRARRIRALPNVLGLAVGRKQTRGLHTPLPCVTVFVSRKVDRADLKPSHRIPRRLRIRVGRGHVFVPVDVVVTGLAQRQSAPLAAGAAASAVRPGASIAHTAYANDNTGTFGAVVISRTGSSSGTQCLLSNYHVLRPPGHAADTYDVDTGSPSGQTIVTPSRQDASGGAVQPLAELVRGEMSATADVALARLLPDAAVDPKIAGIALPAGLRPVSKFEINNTTGQLFGCRSAQSFGMIRELDASMPFDDGTVMHGLILTDKMSTCGDSGAVLLDTSWYLLGLLVGGTPQRSCFVPVYTAIDSAGCEFVTAH